MTDTLFVELLDKTAKLPTKGSINSAGWDLYSPIDIDIKGWESVSIPLKIRLLIPDNIYGRIASRSGLAVKHNIEVGAGVIDSDYRGEIIVLLRNLSSETYTVKKGERIAQIILTKYLNCDIKLSKDINLISTDRGAGGFGSTGRF